MLPFRASEHRKELEEVYTVSVPRSIWPYLLGMNVFSSIAQVGHTGAFSSSAICDNGF